MVDFIKLPRNLVQLSNEIIRAVDLYWNREISEIELKELLWSWAASGKLLEADTINRTIKTRIGKKRTEVAIKLLENYKKF